MEIPRNKLTAGVHVAAVLNSRNRQFQVKNTIRLKAKFASLGTKQINIFNIL